MAAGVPCSPFRSATPHSTASRARRFPLQMIFNCSIFDGNHCSNLDGSGQMEIVEIELHSNILNDSITVNQWGNGGSVEGDAE